MRISGVTHHFHRKFQPSHKNEVSPLVSNTLPEIGLLVVKRGETTRRLTVMWRTLCKSYPQLSSLEVYKVMVK